MRTKRHLLKFAALFAVVAMLLGCTMTTWAAAKRNIKKKYRVEDGMDTIYIDLGEGESISNIKVSKKGLKVKATKAYNNYKVTDKAANDAYNKERKADGYEPITDRHTVRLWTYATKDGKYKVTFNIKKGKKTVKKKVKTTVYVTSAPIKSVKFAGKTYKISAKTLGSKYLYPIRTNSNFTTKKSSGKFSAKVASGYKIVAITYYDYTKKSTSSDDDEEDEDYREVLYKKGKSVKLYQPKDYTYSYDSSYGGYHEDYKNVYRSYAEFRVYLRDTIDTSNNDETSKLFKSKYARSYSVYFEKGI